MISPLTPLTTIRRTSPTGVGTGLPVVTTPVGEVKRVVGNGVNGEITQDRTLESFAHSLDQVRRNLAQYTVAQCTSSIEAFIPAKVLAPIYENYRLLGSAGKE